MVGERATLFWIGTTTAPHAPNGSMVKALKPLPNSTREDHQRHTQDELLATLRNKRGWWTPFYSLS
jgi:hypothetical protein